MLLNVPNVTGSAEAAAEKGNTWYNSSSNPARGNITSGGQKTLRGGKMVETTPRKPYVQRDRRYVVEYVSEHYPNDIAFFNLRMGPAPIAVAEAYPGLDVDRYARVWKKTCDAIVVTADEIVLIEGELRRPSEGLGELLVYRGLIATTPELKPYMNRKIKTILICPMADPTLTTHLKDNNIELVVYRPKWVEDYLKEVMR
jgi:hypothetical protein